MAFFFDNHSLAGSAAQVDSLSGLPPVTVPIIGGSVGSSSGVSGAASGSNDVLPIDKWFNGFTNFLGDTLGNITGMTRQEAYNAEQAYLARQHTTDERIASQIYNSAEAEKARNWQEYMDSSAVQRRMNDLAAAGVNPLYMFTGSGAGIGSSGGGSAASVSSGSSTSASSSSNSAATVAAAIAAIAKVVAALV